MMNGDYGSTRYSKLSQINRENVKNLRMVWALALGGMQDVGQNGPENEVNPLIDNGFMYTTDGWGTIYKIDARDPNRGQFVWVPIPESNTGQRASHARRCIVGGPGHRESSRRTRDCDQTGQRRNRVGQDGRRPPTNSETRKSSSPLRSPLKTKSSSPTAPATQAPEAGSRRSKQEPARNCGDGM